MSDVHMEDLARPEPNMLLEELFFTDYAFWKYSVFFTYYAQNYAQLCQ